MSPPAPPASAVAATVATASAPSGHRYRSRVAGWGWRAIESLMERMIGGTPRLDLLYVRSLFRPADFGGNRYPWEVTRRLARRGHRVRVVTPSLGGPLPGPTDAQLVHYPVSRRTPFETFFGNALFSRLAVRRACRERPPDLIVLSSYEVGFGHFFASVGRRTPTIYIYHGRFQSDAVQRVRSARSPRRLLGAPLQRFVVYLETLIFRSATAIVAVSPHSRSEIVERLGAPDEKIRVISTGVDTEFFSPGDRAAARRTLDLPLDARVLIAVGRLMPIKRYDRALRALALLRARDTRYVLVVVGRGPELESLRSLAAELGLVDAVRFDGYREGDELQLRYRAADVQLCTSEVENWSLSLLEGLSCGVPVVGVPRGGIPEMLRLVDERLIADGVEPGQIADRTGRLFGDPDLLTALGARGRTVVVERFDWEQVADRLERLFVETAGCA